MRLREEVVHVLTALTTILLFVFAAIIVGAVVLRIGDWIAP